MAGLRLQCAAQPQQQRVAATRAQRPLRARCPASTGEERQAATLSSLDRILGSADEDDLAPAARPQATGTPFVSLRVPGWAWKEIQEPRVVPRASNVLYYLFLGVFVLYYVVDLTDGPQVADDLLARLLNDHAAVAAGDTLRLFTCFFVCDKPAALVVGLLALVTVGAELESLIGLSTFWAVWTLCVLTGSTADAAFSQLPITAGPAAGVSGVAGALLAHHLRNWHVEELLAAAKEGELPDELLQLEHKHNAQRLQQHQQQQAQAQGRQAQGQQAQGQQEQGQQAQGQQAQGQEQQAQQLPPQQPRQQQQQQQAQPPRSDAIIPSELVEAEIESPLGGLGGSLKLLVPREGKAFITLAGTATAVVSALRDVADAEVAADWAALVGGFGAGLLLGWMACPVYRLRLVEASSRQTPGAPPDLLLPVLRDTRRPAARANAVLGFAAALFAVLGGWLVSQGAVLG